MFRAHGLQRLDDETAFSQAEPAVFERSVLEPEFGFSDPINSIRTVGEIDIPARNLRRETHEVLRRWPAGLDSAAKLSCQRVRHLVDPRTQFSLE